MHVVCLPSSLTDHAKNKIAGRIIPCLALGFWDKNTGICATEHMSSAATSGVGTRITLHAELLMTAPSDTRVCGPGHLKPRIY